MLPFLTTAPDVDSIKEWSACLTVSTAVCIASHPHDHAEATDAPHIVHSTALSTFIRFLDTSCLKVSHPDGNKLGQSISLSIHYT